MDNFVKAALFKGGHVAHRRDPTILPVISCYNRNRVLSQSRLFQQRAQRHKHSIVQHAHFCIVHARGPTLSRSAKSITLRVSMTFLPRSIFSRAINRCSEFKGNKGIKGLVHVGL